jgi:hypothetical protein
VIFGIRGTAKMKIEGIGGIVTITLTSLGGLSLIVIGALVIGIPP